MTSDNSRRARFASRLAALPTRPGVYIMRNAKGDVIYVGKAANLRNRVRNYFGAPHSLELKTRALVEQIEDFEYIVTQTNGEAMHLEATLVKRHQPFFNVRLKDDKHYPYLRIDVQNEWPRVEIARRVHNDGARYFGPYASASSVRTTLGIVKKLFPWRSCTKTITGTDPRPCLDYFIHRCIAPCTAYCTKEEYDEVIRQTILFLEGKTSEVVKSLKGADAGGVRRAAVRAGGAVPRPDQGGRERRGEAVRRAHPAHGRGRVRPRARTEGTVRGLRAGVLHPRHADGGTRLLHPGRRAGREPTARCWAASSSSSTSRRCTSRSTSWCPSRCRSPALIAEWLTERRGYEGRRRGGAARRAPPHDRARDRERAASRSTCCACAGWPTPRSATRRSSQLQEELDLPTYPRRIECYDNSNIQGTSPVASMVVFIDGQPRPQEYRRFRIKTVVGANDFASMAEILGRRFKRWENSQGEIVEPAIGRANTTPEHPERWTARRSERDRSLSILRLSKDVTRGVLYVRRRNGTSSAEERAVSHRHLPSRCAGRHLPRTPPSGEGELSLHGR